MKNTEIYEMVNKTIIDKLESGVCVWNQPWVCGGTSGFWNRETAKGYSLYNSLLIMAQGGEMGEYATFKQIQKAKGKVNKGAKSKMVVFFKMEYLKDKDGNIVYDEETNKPVMLPILRYYRVFAIADTNLEPKHNKAVNGTRYESSIADSLAEQYSNKSGCRINEITSNDAFYAPSGDYITIPSRGQHKSLAEFESTRWHEITHSTGHKTRLDRLSKKASFGNDEYSKEELVAEIGSSIFRQYLGLSTESADKNSIGYLQGWIRACKDDPQLIPSACKKAQEAFEYIMDMTKGFSPSIMADDKAMF